MEKQPLYILCFREIIRNYNFGGRWIPESFDKPGLPVEGRVAETWEVCDRPGESNVVTNGPLAGKTLHELIGSYEEQLLGSGIVKRSGMRFPLLIKLLDATYPLGEQAHHDNELAKRKGLEDPGKTEAWYMLRTRPGATVRCGNIDAVDKRKIENAIVDGTIKECMKEYRVNPGDGFLLYAGTMHYSPGGVLFYEIMQNSDVFIALKDFGNRMTEEQRRIFAKESLEGVHIENEFECKVVPLILRENKMQRQFIFASEYFVLERLDIKGTCILPCDGTAFFVLTTIDGVAEITDDHGSVTLRSGQSCLVPACSGNVEIRQDTGFILKAYVPDLMADIIRPLRKKGFDDHAIELLGGKTVLNPLTGLLRQSR